MIGIDVDKRGLLQLKVDAGIMDRDLRAAIKDLAREYQGKVAAELSRPKSGRLYGDRNRAQYRIVRRRVTLFGGQRRTVTRRERTKAGPVQSWRASRAGEAPAVFTGNLLRGLRIATPGREKGYGAKVFSSRRLAAHRHLLEFGTSDRIQRTWRGKAVNRHVGRVLPRPIWTPFQARATEDLYRRTLAVIDASVALRGAP